jgi:hypothetical protein
MMMGNAHSVDAATQLLLGVEQSWWVHLPAGQ